MTDLITLVAPFGAELAPICSHDREFHPYLEDPRAAIPRWLVDVTPRAAHEFKHGGFHLYQPQMRRRLSGDKASLIRIAGPTSVSFDGEEIHSEETVMPSGDVVHMLTVPAEAVPELQESHPELLVPSAAHYETPTTLKEIRAAVGEKRAELAAFDKANPDAKGRADAAALDEVAEDAGAPEPRPKGAKREAK